MPASRTRCAYGDNCNMVYGDARALLVTVIEAVLAKDFEASIASAKAWLFIPSVQLLIRRAARANYNVSDS